MIGLKPRVRHLPHRDFQGISQGKCLRKEHFAVKVFESNRGVLEIGKHARILIAVIDCKCVGANR